MNNDIRFYIVTSEAIEKESVLEKMLTLICNNKASVTKYNNIFESNLFGNFFQLFIAQRISEFYAILKPY